MIAPEPVHGGTNIAIGNDQVTVLLNGAFSSHEHNPPYSKSRGLVVLESLDLDLLRGMEADGLIGVEPFTMVRFSQEVEEVRWDGSLIHYRNFDPDTPLLVVSAQLYSEESRQKRQEWFHTFLKEFSGSPEVVFDFHRTGGDGDPHNDMVMNRDGLVQTVSITQVAHFPGDCTLRHLNLIDNREHHLKLGNDGFE